MFTAPNNIFTNWNKVCYIRPRLEPVEDDYGNQIAQYGEPIKLSFNYQPVTNDADTAQLKAYGITSIGTVKALIDRKHLSKLNEFDLVYLYGANPKNEQFKGQNANYRIITSIEQNTKILVYFEKLTKNQGGNYEASKK